MSLIDNTYFVGSILIAGLDNSKSGNKELLPTFIDEREKEVRRCGLGVKLDNELQTAIDALVAPPDFSLLPEPWKSLVLGKEYEIEVSGDMVTVVWGGLLNIQGTSKISLISFYTYWFWMDNAKNRQGVSATIVPDLENSNVISNHDNMVRAWRNFIRLYGQCRHCNHLLHRHDIFHCSHLTKNTNTIFSGNIERSLKEFIEDQNDLVPDTFADWTWKPFANQNSSGI